ncbi:MAG: radical SAM protein [Proteobacteria bacterium]|nr:radical SAM protein [Pseudomonadota bacterium]
MSAALLALAEEAGVPQAVASRLLSLGARFASRPFFAATPSFKPFESDALGACRSGAFPAFSITGGACALNCKHCRAEILKPMLPTGDPAAFEALVTTMIERQGLRGFLLSGGSNLRNEVPFDRYLPVIRRLKDAHAELEVLAHTGLVDAGRAKALKEAGVDVAMLDIIGDQDTIREIYHLDRPVADFEEALANLVAAGLEVVPHIVIGLHYGLLRGERSALEMIARHKTRAAILVVVMPAYADARFTTPERGDVIDFFAEAREMLSDRALILGCARPHGVERRALDVAATLAGFDGVAYPVDEAVEVAKILGRPFAHRHACCGTSSCAKAA